MSDAIDSRNYAGRDNLEAMEEAERYNRFLASLIEEVYVPGSHVLDFGAGGGTFARPLARRGVDVTCVEPDEILSRRLASAGLTTVPGLERLPAASFNLIYSFNVLEHIEDDRSALRSLASRLKPGGRLLLYVPAFQSLYSSMDRKVGHFRRYRRRPLVTLIEAAGLEVLRAEYVDSLGFAAALAFRMLGNASGDIHPRSVRLYDRFAFPLSRALDRVLRHAIGKNVLVLARKP
jgi:SAM-dependent methyltransferase